MLLGSVLLFDSFLFFKIWLVLFGVFVLGLGVGILFLLLVELLNCWVCSVDDLMLFDVLVLGVMIGF